MSDKNVFLQSLGARVKELRTALNMSQDELAIKMGYKHKSSINKLELGINDIPQSKIILLADALDTTPAYLMGGESASDLPSNMSPLEPMEQIPLVGRIACGTPVLAEENIEEYIDLPRHIKADYALTCHGDSMIGAGIRDGDVVYIRKQPIVETGQIAAVRIGDDATLKRFYADGDTVTLMPENSAIRPLVFIGEEINSIIIEGLAVAYTHKLVR